MDLHGVPTLSPPPHLPLQACMFVNVSPLIENIGETISSLEFGQNVRQVELGKATKHLTRQTE